MSSRLVLVTGISGTGKTILCRKIIENWDSPVRIVHLDKDTVMKEYSRARGTTRKKLLEYYDSKRELFYEYYYHLAENALKKGGIVLLDNPHVKELLHYPEWRKTINDICKRTGSDLAMIKCFMISVEDYKDRLRKRGSKRDERKLSDEESFRSFLEYEPLDFPTPKGSLVVETSGEIDIKNIIEHILESEGIVFE